MLNTYQIIFDTLVNQHFDYLFSTAYLRVLLHIGAFMSISILVRRLKSNSI